MSKPCFDSIPRSLVLATLLVLLPGAASAQDFFGQPLIKPGEETFTLLLGGIVNQFDTSVQLNGQSSRGTDINLEDNGLSHRHTSFDVAATWRFFSRHRLSAEYFTADRSGSRTYSNSITIGDNTYPLGATVSADAENRFLIADYRYSFVKSDNLELGVGFGFYGARFSFDLTATGSQGGNTRTTTTSSSTPIPLPVVGVSADWYLNPRWKIAGFVEGMKAEISHVDGRVLLAGVSSDYMFTRNLGIGARYMYTDVNADVTKANFNGHLDWRTNNVLLYAKLMF